jgi:hypothetical protein
MSFSILLSSHTPTNSFALILTNSYILLGAPASGEEGNHWQGHIDEVSVWSQALPPEAIALLQFHKFVSHLVLSHPFLPLALVLPLLAPLLPLCPGFLFVFVFVFCLLFLLLSSTSTFFPSSFHLPLLLRRSSLPGSRSFLWY